MKWPCSLLLIFVAMICKSGETSTLTTNPVAAVKAVLPKGWLILNAEEGTHPSSRPEGNGIAVVLGVSGKEYGKQQCSAVLYLMPLDSGEIGKDPSHGQAQSPSPRLIATAKNGKLYIWPPNGEAEGWRTMQEDLLKALVRSSEPGGPADGSQPIPSETNRTSSAAVRIIYDRTVFVNADGTRTNSCEVPWVSGLAASRAIVAAGGFSTPPTRHAKIVRGDKVIPLDVQVFGGGGYDPILKPSDVIVLY
jgi:hypothetical protein